MSRWESSRLWVGWDQHPITFPLQSHSIMTFQNLCLPAPSQHLSTFALQIHFILTNLFSIECVLYRMCSLRKSSPLCTDFSESLPPSAILFAKSALVAARLACIVYISFTYRVHIEYRPFWKLSALVHLLLKSLDRGLFRNWPASCTDRQKVRCLPAGRV